MYSVDYPLEDNRDGSRSLEEVQKRRWLTEKELNIFAHKNAEKLFKVKIKESSIFIGVYKSPKRRYCS